MIPKKDHSVRFLNDLRELNKRINKITNIAEVLVIGDLNVRFHGRREDEDEVLLDLNKAPKNKSVKSK